MILFSTSPYKFLNRCRTFPKRSLVTISIFRWIPVVSLSRRKLSWSACWHDRRQNVKCQQLTAFKRFQSGLGENPRLALYDSNGCRRSEKQTGSWFCSLVAVLGEVLTAITVFWNVTPYSLTGIHGRFGPTYCLHLHRQKYTKNLGATAACFVCCLPTTIKMVAVCSFKTSVNYRTTRSHTSEEYTRIIYSWFVCRDVINSHV
jgi:hypothetical protein